MKLATLLVALALLIPAPVSAAYIYDKPDYREKFIKCVDDLVMTTAECDRILGEALYNEEALAQEVDECQLQLETEKSKADDYLVGGIAVGIVVGSGGLPILVKALGGLIALIL